MCGRTRSTLARQDVARAAGVEPEDFVDGDKYKPVQNMGPGRYGPVVVQPSGAAQGEKKTEIRLQAMRWGLVPSFTKPNAKPDHFVMFNARSENVRERPAFKRLLQSKRCVVLCDGYYEWQQVDKREKQPYYFYREGKPMKFAGLYDQWTNGEGELMYTYTILTTNVAPELKWLHTRMPVILSDDGVSRWLSGEKFEKLEDLLVSYSDKDLKWHPVDKKVGSMQFQSEDCTKKVDIKHAGDIKSFFGVKKEKQEVDASAAAKIKTEANSANSPVKKDVLPQSPKKEHVGFAPASTLLQKRATREDEGSQPFASPSKRLHSPPTKLKSPRKEAKKHSRNPKQGTLDQFFKKN